LRKKFFQKIQRITELSNPAEHLYTNEPNLKLNISNIINFQSPIFHNESHLNNNESEESGDESSEEDDEDNEYDVNEIVASIERMQCT
jgi:hypothetical protein